MGVSFKLVSVICVVEAALAGMSDLCVKLPWAYDESVCQTRTVTNLFYFSAALVARLSGLDLALANGKSFMDRAGPLLKEAAKKPWNHGVVLGDAELCGVLEEAALTFKEICQLPSNYYHMLDVRHGPMVLIGPETVAAILLTGTRWSWIWYAMRLPAARWSSVITYSDQPTPMEGTAEHLVRCGAAACCAGHPIHPDLAAADLSQIV